MLLPPSRCPTHSAGSAPAGQTLGEPGPRLSQLAVTDVTASSLRLNWEAPSGAFDSFLLRYGVPSASTLEPHVRPLLQREVAVPGTRRSAVLRDLRPGTLYSLTLYGLRGPHSADSVQGTARTLSPGEAPRRGAGEWGRGRGVQGDGHICACGQWPRMVGVGVVHRSLACALTITTRHTAPFSSGEPP